MFGIYDQTYKTEKPCTKLQKGQCLPESLFLLSLLRPPDATYRHSKPLYRICKNFQSDYLWWFEK